MLPLPLYFSAEFNLLNAPQLLRGLQQAALRENAAVEAELKSLELSLREEAPPPDNDLAALPAYHLPPSCPEVFTTELANHNFNLCLKRIETAAGNGPSAMARVNPAQLHPNCHPQAGEQQYETLVRKLLALAQIADQHQVCLVLSLPSESRLELWLRLLQHLLAEPSLNHCVGIELSAQSSRLLPTLGYLERLSRDHQRRVPIRLFQRAAMPWQLRFDGGAGRLTCAASVRLNLTAACAFLESGNGARLRPQLVVSDADLSGLLHQLHREHGWPVSLLADPAGESPLPLLSGAPDPGLLAGARLVQERSAQLLAELREHPPRAVPIINGLPQSAAGAVDIPDPGALELVFGSLLETTESQAREAFAGCSEAQEEWRHCALEERRRPLATFSTLLGKHQLEIAIICALQTGKPVRDGLLEIQEARMLIERHLQLAEDVLKPQSVQGLPVEQCRQETVPLGVLVALIPWSQPILQFCAMSSAALLTGNALVVKPAENASLVSSRLFSLLLRAGIPPSLIALLTGSLEVTAPHLFDDYRLDGVLFCGNPSVALAIQQRLAGRLGAPMLPFLTDTGGRHIALMDDDQSINELLPRLLHSAFAHNGQHSASLRVLYVEESIAEQVELCLQRAIVHLRVGAAAQRATDLGPLVNREQMTRIHLHIEHFRAQGRLLAQPPLGEELEESYHVPPALVRLYSLDELQEQIDGPVLHLIRFNRQAVGRCIDEINRCGFGVALTLFSNDPALQQQVTRDARVGELNLNPMGLHPHLPCCPGSGLGLSGSAPRPGSADYLEALIRRQRICQGPTIS